MLWIDPLAGTVVIANSSFGLVRDTGGIPLDRTPDTRIANRVRATIECEATRMTNLHLWRLPHRKRPLS